MHYTIGVLAKRGIDQTERQWSATARYLTARIPGATFSIVPVTFDAIESAVAHRDMDFVLTNPAQYVTFELNYGAARIATLRNASTDHALDRFGSVVFTAARTTDIRAPRDVRGRRVAAVNPGSLGGWLVAADAFAGHNIDLGSEAGNLSFLGTHDAVVEAVLAGSEEVGIVRTDTLERMAADGAIDPDAIRVIDLVGRNPSVGSAEPPGHEVFPFMLSTQLFPEWPIAVLPHVDSRLAELVAAALLEMDPESVGAREAFSRGWSVPQNYQPVHLLLQRLHAPPYETWGEVSLSDVLREYRWWIATIVVLAAAMILALVLLVRRQTDLLRLRRDLELRVVERTAALEASNNDLRRSLSENEALLAEVHHRVKNNLQVIVSLMNLQLDDVRDPADRNLMERLQSRISSMSLVHESFEALSRSAAIPVSEFVRSLAVQSMQTAGVHAGAEVSVEFQMEDVRLDLARAVPFGLVVCELLSNAFMHGRLEGSRLAVQVSLEHRDQDGVVLHVRDNGPGFEEPAEDCPSRRIGLMLVRLLVDQLSGEFALGELRRGAGTDAMVSFPLPVPAEAIGSGLRTRHSRPRVETESRP